MTGNSPRWFDIFFECQINELAKAHKFMERLKSYLYKDVYTEDCGTFADALTKAKKYEASRRQGYEE